MKRLVELAKMIYYEMWHLATMGEDVMSITIEKAALGKSRLNVRLSPEVKVRIARAASILGQDLTEFAAVTLNDRAEEVLERHFTLELSREDHRFFIDFMAKEDAWEPSEKERELVDQYKQGVRKGLKYEFTD